MTNFLIPLTLGFVLDILLGDPERVPHPVCLMGLVISKMELILRKKSGHEKLKGLLLVVGIVFIFTAGPWLVLLFLYKINFILGLFVESVFCWQCLAAKGLRQESMKVYYALKNFGVEEGRAMVSRIVGRDTKRLDEKGVIKATVETVAENTSDGVIAPIFYMFLGGGVLGYCYKAINTMDSMVGYKNERYINFGMVAAKLDDVANFIPARLAGLLMVVSAFILKLNGKNSWVVFKRDRHNHKSPNSAQTEAACAGALGVCLGGNAWYFGKLYEKPTIGTALEEIELEHIVLANRLMYGTSFLAVFISNLFWLT